MNPTKRDIQRQRVLRVFLAAAKSGSMTQEKPRTAETILRAAGLKGCSKPKYLPQAGHNLLTDLREPEFGAWPIASSTEGYWYARNAFEMLPTILLLKAHLKGIARSLKLLFHVRYGREL